MESKKVIYGLPKAGILVNQLIKKKIAKYGYYEVPHTPDLWKQHKQIFTLVNVVYDIVYVNKRDMEPQVTALKDH